MVKSLIILSKYIDIRCTAIQEIQIYCAQGTHTHTHIHYATAEILQSLELMLFLVRKNIFRTKD